MRRSLWGSVLLLILVLWILMLFAWFTNEVQRNEAIAYSVIFLAIGGAYELWRWLRGRTLQYRFAFGVGLFGLLLLGWVSGAVGIIGSENNNMNLLYFAVPVVFLVGLLFSRLRPQGMKYTLFVTAVVQFLVPVVALVISQSVSWGDAGVLGVFVLNTFFSVVFFVSGILFSKSARVKSFVGPSTT